MEDETLMEDETTSLESLAQQAAAASLQGRDIESLLDGLVRRAADTSRAHGEALQTRTSAQASLEKVQQDMAVGQLRVGYLLDFEDKLKQQQVAMNEELRVTSVALARLAPALSAGSDSGAAAVGPRMHHAETGTATASGFTFGSTKTAAAALASSALTGFSSPPPASQPPVFSFGGPATTTGEVSSTTASAPGAGTSLAGPSFTHAPAGGFSFGGPAETAGGASSTATSVSGAGTFGASPAPAFGGSASEMKCTRDEMQWSPDCPHDADKSPPDEAPALAEEEECDASIFISERLRGMSNVERDGQVLICTLSATHKCNHSIPITLPSGIPVRTCVLTLEGPGQSTGKIGEDHKERHTMDTTGVATMLRPTPPSQTEYFGPSNTTNCLSMTPRSKGIFPTICRSMTIKGVGLILPSNTCGPTPRSIRMLPTQKFQDTHKKIPKKFDKKKVTRHDTAWKVVSLPQVLYKVIPVTTRMPVYRIHDAIDATRVDFGVLASVFNRGLYLICSALGTEFVGGWINEMEFGHYAAEMREQKGGGASHNKAICARDRVVTNIQATKRNGAVLNIKRAAVASGERPVFEAKILLTRNDEPGHGSEGETIAFINVKSTTAVGQHKEHDKNQLDYIPFRLENEENEAQERFLRPTNTQGFVLLADRWMDLHSKGTRLSAHDMYPLHIVNSMQEAEDLKHPDEIVCVLVNIDRLTRGLCVDVKAQDLVEKGMKLWHNTQQREEQEEQEVQEEQEEQEEELFQAGAASKEEQEPYEDEEQDGAEDEGDGEDDFGEDEEELGAA